MSTSLAEYQQKAFLPPIEFQNDDFVYTIVDEEGTVVEEAETYEEILEEWTYKIVYATEFSPHFMIDLVICIIEISNE